MRVYPSRGAEGMKEDGKMDGGVQMRGGEYTMEKVAGKEDARGEERQVGDSSLLRFRGREGRGMQQAHEGRARSVS